MTASGIRSCSVLRHGGDYNRGRGSSITESRLGAQDEEEANREKQHRATAVADRDINDHRRNELFERQPEAVLVVILSHLICRSES